MNIVAQTLWLYRSNRSGSINQELDCQQRSGSSCTIVTGIISINQEWNHHNQTGIGSSTSTLSGWSALEMIISINFCLNYWFLMRMWSSAPLRVKWLYFHASKIISINLEWIDHHRNPSLYRPRTQVGHQHHQRIRWSASSRVNRSSLTAKVNINISRKMDPKNQPREKS